MSEPTFEELMQNHEMGQAYLAITERMGPSAQLIAFVNYQNNGVEEVGLESFDLSDSHAKILKDIENDPSLNMAMENLKDKMRNFIDGAKEMIPDAIDAANLAFDSVDLGTKVHPHAGFKRLVSKFEEMFKFDLQIASGIPSTFDVKAWKTYHDNIMGSSLYQFWWGKGRKPKQIEINDKVKYSESGWSEATFEAAVKWYETHCDKVELLQKRYADKLAKIEHWVTDSDQSDKNNREVLKYISEILGVSTKVFRESETTLVETKKVLDSVARAAKKKN